MKDKINIMIHVWPMRWPHQKHILFQLNISFYFDQNINIYYCRDNGVLPLGNLNKCICQHKYLSSVICHWSSLASNQYCQIVLGQRNDIIKVRMSEQVYYKMTKTRTSDNFLSVIEKVNGWNGNVQRIGGLCCICWCSTCLFVPKSRCKFLFLFFKNLFKDHNVWK